jgi:hypothetical protein
MQCAVTRPPDSNRGAIFGPLPSHGRIDATSNSGGGSGGRAAVTPGGFAEGVSFTLSATVTGCGTVPRSSFSPSCFSTASTMPPVAPESAGAAPDRDLTCSGYLRSMSQAPSMPVESTTGRLSKKPGASARSAGAKRFHRGATALDRSGGQIAEGRSQAPASAGTRAISRLQFRLALARRKHPGRRRPGAVFRHQLETIRQQGLQHQLQCLRTCPRRSSGDHLEAIVVEPARPSIDLVGVDPVRGPDQIEHGGAPQLISVAVKKAALHPCPFHPIGARLTRTSAMSNAGGSPPV